MLSMRKRGKAQIFYIRGTVTLGDRRINVKEYSSGTSDRDAAAHELNKKERELREQLMFGPRALVAQVTVADAFEAYLSKPAKPNSSDILRIGKLNEIIGEMPMSDPHAAWTKFRTSYLTDHKPAGQDRYRCVLQAAINFYRDGVGLEKIKIPTIKFKNERLRFLSEEERDRLICCYPAHVQPIVLVLAFQGARTQDGLQLQWGAQGVDVHRNEIWIEDAKTKTFRMVPMHPRVSAALRELWEERGRPKSGHVFLNRVGKPYQDTRKAKVQGGNPLKASHRTACRKAGIANFKIHDWRHHFASHCVMSGVDMESLRQLGGWASYRMIQRYATVSSAHLRASIAKLA